MVTAEIAQATGQRPTAASPVRLVYLLAASHSGSTLLAMLLGSHPEVSTVGELKLTSLGDVTQYRCSCRQLVQQCEFWSAVQRDMEAQGYDFDFAQLDMDHRTGASPRVLKLLRPLHRGPVLEGIRDRALSMFPSWRRSLPQIQDRNLALMRCVARVTGNNLVVDSSKIGIRLKYLLRIPQLDVRVVRLIRDGRAVALTYMDPASFADAKDPSLRSGGMGGDREGEKLSMEDAAREWRRSNEEAESILSKMDSSKVMQVHYEDLCTQTRTTLDTLFSFLGVDPKLRPENFRSKQQHVVGNGMRLDNTSEIRLDDRWKSALTAEHLAVFDRVAGAMNHKLGYV